MSSAVNKHRVGVFIRIKPTDRFANEVIELLPNSNSLNIHTRKEKNRGHINNQILDWHFPTDGVLHNASQEEVYEKCASQLVTLTLDGYNNTLFAYGQTGSGKTYTMTGTTGNFQHRGIIPRAISKLYKDIDQRLEYDITVRISYLEIYKENMFDLLATLDGGEQRYQDLTISEDDQGMTYVKGLACHVAKTEEEALNLLFEGETNRTISEHLLNRTSSRSHCIFTIYCESHSRTQSNTKYTTSKFNFVDLAGSERLSKTLSEGKTQEEARYINKALTFLEQTVIALDDKKRIHVPYRQSTLTHLLKDSLGGKCSTVMIGNIWGEEAQLEETLSTLRFASRVMNIPSQPSVNSHYDPILLCKQYEKEITHLRKELAMYDTLTNRNQVNYEPLSDMQIKDIQQQVRRYVDNDIPEIDIINNRQVKEVFTQFKVFISLLESDIENKFKEKSTATVKVTESSPMPPAEKPSVNTGKAGLVGISDGSNFSVGKATTAKAPVPSAIATARKKNRRQRKDSSDDGKLNRPTSDIKSTISVFQPLENVVEVEVVTSPTPERPSTPPTKENAFGIFKSEQGRDLHRLFQENKELLNNKKREAKELSVNINNTKKEIDETKLKLDIINENKEREDSIGESYLDEEEFELITKLKTLKNIYRLNYEYLQNLRTDFVYCENIVKLSRQKLLSEYEVWYCDSFGVPIPNVVVETKPEKNDPLSRSSPKDEGEKFESVQKELLMAFPESVAFYNARIYTDRRKLFNRSLKKRSVLPAIHDNLPKTMIAH